MKNSQLEFLNLDLPGFNLVKYIFNNHQSHLNNRPIFHSYLRRGQGNKNFYKASFISDLGLRRTQEPTNFFQQNIVDIFNGCKKIDYKFPFHDQTVLNVFSKIGRQLNTLPFNFRTFIKKYINEPEILNEVIKYYADVFGNWTDADLMAEYVLSMKNQVTTTNDGAALLANCGNLLAHTGNPLCREAYYLAKLYWKDPYQKLTSQFRIAVAEIKRLNQPENIPMALEKAYKSAKEFSEVTGNKNDMHFTNGLIKNLEALYHIKNKRIEEAGDCISSALKTISSISSDMISIDPDISYRYRLQILENYALFSGMTSNWINSLPIYEQAVKISREHHPDSLGEVLAMYGYSLIQANKSNEAIPVLRESEALFTRSIWIEKVPEVRKMLAVAYDNIGQDEQALYWLSKVSKYQNSVVSPSTL